MNQIVDNIEAAGLPAPLYRTARRLFDRTDSAGSVRLSYENLRRLCDTDNDATTRSHLVKLRRAGLIRYQRNGLVDVWFVAEPVVSTERANRANCTHLDDSDADEVSTVRADCANCTHLDSPDADDVSTERAIRANCTQCEYRTRESRELYSLGLTTANQTTTTAGWQASQPEPEPGEGAGGGTDDPDDDAEPVTALDRAVGLLTDPAVGLAEAAARELASAYGWDELLRQVMRFVRDLDAGQVHSPAVLRRRLRDRYAADITDQDRASALYQRHVGEVDEAEERRRRWIPDEYRDVIIG